MSTSFITDPGLEMLDITKPATPVEVHIQKNGVLHVNTEGRCVLRICRIPDLIVEDERFSDRWRTFDEHDWILWPGCESVLPLVYYGDDRTIVIDYCCVYVQYNGKHYARKFATPEIAHEFADFATLIIHPETIVTMFGEPLYITECP